ncbi:hypothetical protein CDAR_48351 [Caerostris darwini]|uniref:Uncharacterized protein n=1 Tax=Caerostris darwini TaxID=1538125 RepID=A0AAV4W1N6_9ARAC|nr:hypothetical protein CDAR_48351 [Caerostris darwini]
MPIEATVLTNALHSFLDIAVDISFESHTLHFRRTLRQRIGFISVSTHRIEIAFHFERVLWLQAPYLTIRTIGSDSPRWLLFWICPVSAPWRVSCLLYQTCE